MRDSLANQLAALIHGNPLTNPVQSPAAQFRARGNTMPIDKTPIHIEQPQQQKEIPMSGNGPKPPEPVTPEPDSGNGPKPPPTEPLPPVEPVE